MDFSPVKTAEKRYVTAFKCDTHSSKNNFWHTREDRNKVNLLA